VLLARWDVDRISDPHLHDAILELQPGSPLEHDHPFVHGLFVPKAVGPFETIRSMLMPWPC
jgi:hypothetical protein